MSGIVGHTLYAVLGAKAAATRRLPVAPLMRRHFASYLAGAYIGSDIQMMPEAICVDTGQEVGVGTTPLEKSPITGGALRPFKLVTPQGEFSPRRLYELFYGRSHLVFGWAKGDHELAVPWEHLPEYFGAVAGDALGLFGLGERPLAYALGWMVHVVSDCLIKSIWPGIDLHLLDGKYTPRNRPIQDLVSFHEIGVKELGLNWPALFADLADTPVEPVQLHYMRVAQRRGALGRLAPDGWAPEKEPLLRAVLAENRRYVRVHARHVLADMKLSRTPQGWDCNETIRKTVGLNYAGMVELARKANFRHALWQMGEAVANMFAAVAQHQPVLANLPVDDGTAWDELARRWRKP
ncbi:MAG: hypothetical protein WCV00_19905 [Verrucomicrobiia bacterium]